MSLIHLFLKSARTVWAPALLLGLSLSTQAAEKLALNQDGIKVWTYQAANNPILQYRAETIFDTSVENAVGLILDAERGKRWIPYVADLRTLEPVNNQGKMLIYMRLDMPFPLSDRDLIAQAQLSKTSDGKITLTNRGVMDNRIAPKSGIVRITRYEGNWVFEKIAPNQVKVTTSGYADPGGAVPANFANTFVKQQPFQMLSKMRQQLKTSNYKMANLPAILHEVTK